MKLICVRCGSKNSKWLHVSLEHGTCAGQRKLLSLSSPLCLKCAKAVASVVTDMTVPRPKSEVRATMRSKKSEVEAPHGIVRRGGPLYCPKCGMDLVVHRKRHGAHCTFKASQFAKKVDCGPDPNDFGDAF